MKCSLWYSKQRIFILYLFFVWLLVMKQFSVQNYFSWWLKIKTYCYTYPILIWIHHINYQKVYIKKRNIYFIKNYQEITMDSRTAVLKILLYHEIKKTMLIWKSEFFVIFYVYFALTSHKLIDIANYVGARRRTFCPFSWKGPKTDKLLWSRI